MLRGKKKGRPRQKMWDTILNGTMYDMHIKKECRTESNRKQKWRDKWDWSSGPADRLNTDDNEYVQYNYRQIDLTNTILCNTYM